MLMAAIKCPLHLTTAAAAACLSIGLCWPHSWWTRTDYKSSLSVQNLVCDQICQNHFFADIDRRHHNTCSDKTGIFCAHRKLCFFSCFKTSYVAAAKTCPCKTSYLPRMCASGGFLPHTLGTLPLDHNGDFEVAIAPVHTMQRGKN